MRSRLNSPPDLTPSPAPGARACNLPALLLVPWAAAPGARAVAFFDRLVGASGCLGPGGFVAW